MSENLKAGIRPVVFPVLAPIAISAFMGYMQGQTLQAVMREKIATIEKESARHELERGQDISRLNKRNDDHEQRIVRLETNLGVIQATLSEVRADVKTLLRGHD